MTASNKSTASPWPYRFALALCCLTFPLLWVGGLVTSTDAGMAVPDWPTTYGYNMFSYPWQTWLFGPWDLFIEHGHRLLASVVGLLTIVCGGAVRMRDKRHWVHWFALAMLVMVVLQGLLGGLRVIENQRLLAMVHGCTGPLFFAMTVVLAVATSRSWRAEGATNRRGPSGLFLTLAVLAYLQLCLGAQLRHTPETASPWAFAGIVKLHLIGAAVVTLFVFVAARQAMASSDSPAVVRRLGVSLIATIVLQLALGVGTWLVKYGAPGWAVGLLPATMEPTIADGLAQTHLATGHSACGSLVLGLATAAAAYSLRFGESNQPTTTSPAINVTGATA